MVRTYTWNPSTQSSPAIFGNFADEGEKSVNNLFSNKSKNPCCDESSDSIYNTDKVTNAPKSTASNNTPSNAADGFSTVFYTYPHHSIEKTAISKSQATLLQQPHPTYYPTAVDVTTIVPNHCYYEPHLLRPQLASSLILDQASSIKPIDPRHLRPVQIGNKIYFEPLQSGSTLFCASTPCVVRAAAPTSSVAVPNNTLIYDSNLSQSSNTVMSMHRVPTANVFMPKISESARSNQWTHPKASGNQQEQPQPTTSDGTKFVSSLYAGANSQPNSEFCGIYSWQTPLPVSRNHPILDKTSKLNAAPSITYQTSQCHTTASDQSCDCLQKQSPAKTTLIPKQQWATEKVKINPEEQYKRDLQLQIESNRRRKEEERQREIEIEKKEMTKFAEYRKKVKQEMEEEERKEKEKILAAQRKVARMQALQEEAAKCKTSVRTLRNCNESVKGEGGKLSTTSQSSYCLDWWEKKNGRQSDEIGRTVQSPIIPSLRSSNMALEMPTNVTNYPSSVPSKQFNRSRTFSRRSQRKYHSSMASKRNHSSDSVREHRRSSQIFEHHELASNISRKGRAQSHNSISVQSEALEAMTRN